VTRRFLAASGMAAAGALAVGACSSTPTAPPPPVVNNTPPTIESVTISSDRAEAGQPLTVTAVVIDAETSVDRLTYLWSASPSTGAFSGTGASVTWTPPSGQTTPDLYTVTLTVLENFTSAGQVQQNKVSKSAQVQYNDSLAEINGLAVQFLSDFGDFSVSPEQCVRNFSNNCPGKANELADIENNRANYHILGATWTATPSITLDAGRTHGTWSGACTFEDIPNPGVGPNAGKKELVSGTCLLETVYEQFRWWLCVSNFDAPFNTTVESLRGRVPGQVTRRFEP
jgi:hypothetical protein